MGTFDSSWGRFDFRWGRFDSSWGRFDFRWGRLTLRGDVLTSGGDVLTSGVYILVSFWLGDILTCYHTTTAIIELSPLKWKVVVFLCSDIIDYYVISTLLKRSIWCGFYLWICASCNDGFTLWNYHLNI